MCGTCGCSETDFKHSHFDKTINLESAVMAENDKYASINRQAFREKNLLCLNVVSSPGSGKTTLLQKMIPKLKQSYDVAVIEGDQHTEIDANRIRAAGAKAYQINTGKSCHLDAHQIGHALEHLHQDENFNSGILIIENVGNLICPAMFDLGEHKRITLISTTEGDDKPLKYPEMFHTADLILITKMDLIEYVDFEVKKCEANIRKINSKANIICLSAKSGTGLDDLEVFLNDDYSRLINQKPSATQDN